MENSMTNEINQSVEGLRQAAKCVYLACYPSEAEDISSKLKWAANEIDRLTSGCQQLTEALNGAIDDKNYWIKQAEALNRTPEELQRLADLQDRGLLVEIPCLVNKRSVLTRHSQTRKLVTIRYDTREAAEKALEEQK